MLRSISVQSLIAIKVDNGRVKDPVFRCCVGLFLFGNSFSYGERTICATYYQKGGAPAVLENPECSSWVLSNNFYRNHTVNCLLAGFTNFEDGEKHFKERFFCDLDLQIPFLGENGSIEDVKVGMVAVFDHNGVEDSAKRATNLLKNYFLVHTYFLRDETYAFNKLMGPLSYKEDHDMVFPELNQVNKVDQLIRRIFFVKSLSAIHAPAQPLPPSSICSCYANEF
uniref:Uncharacterized protein n=1 Tax=Quercus lobata TaxID=97700 RepID=A0A7N2LSG9_QUELO